MNKLFGRAIAAIGIMVVATGCSRPHSEAPSDSRRTVVVIRPQRGDMVRSITLPGDLVGLYQSTLYAKVTGYLKSISVDKGDWVKEGQVLAVIEVPELQQRLARAKADMEVQHLTYQRLEQVWKSDPRLVARQDVDIAQGKYFEAKAQTDELEAMVSYTRIVAPFDGVITGRFVDPGALIKAGGDQAASAPDQGSAHPNGGTSPVLSLAMIDTMRTYVYVPEDGVGIDQARNARETGAARYCRDVRSRDMSRAYSNSLDLGTRTMLTEIDLSNPHHELYPGMYANVTLELERHRDAIKLPEAAVGDSPDGKYVMIAQDGKLRRQGVVVGINTGKSVEIVRGLGGGEAVVATLDPSIVPDEAVNIVEQKAGTAERSNMVADTQ